MFLELLSQILSNLFYLALHVTGAGSFPPPLSAKREAELLAKKEEAMKMLKINLLSIICDLLPT